jgi:alginate O-acetyltransferase complex protein AlgI
LCLYLDEPDNAKRIKRRALIRKTAFVLTVAADLGLLAVIKYAAFGITNLNRLLPLDLAVPNILLPIGISFFTFQALS